jgi:hypothetical protein
MPLYLPDITLVNLFDRRMILHLISRGGALRPDPISAQLCPFDEWYSQPVAVYAISYMRRL